MGYGAWTLTSALGITGSSSSSVFRFDLDGGFPAEDVLKEQNQWPALVSTKQKPDPNDCHSLVGQSDSHGTPGMSLHLSELVFYQ